MKYLFFILAFLFGCSAFAQGPVYVGLPNDKVINKGYTGSQKGIINAIRDTNSVPLAERINGLLIIGTDSSIYVWKASASRWLAVSGAGAMKKIDSNINGGYASYKYVNYRIQQLIDDTSIHVNELGYALIRVDSILNVDTTKVPSIYMHGLKVSKATINNTGSFGGATTIPRVTVNADGLVTGVSGTAITPAESSITFSDITTGDVSTSKHGFVPKADGSSTHYLTGAGTWSALPNVGTAGTYGSSTAVPIITTDAQGRVSGVTTTTIAGSTGTIYTFAETSANANYTAPGLNYFITLSAPSLTTGRTITLPAGVGGATMIIVNYNTTANSWVTSPSYRTQSGGTTSALANQTLVRLIYDGTLSIWRVW